jgi:hypothetical protein
MVMPLSEMTGNINAGGSRNAVDDGKGGRGRASRLRHGMTLGA